MSEGGEIALALAYAASKLAAAADSEGSLQHIIRIAQGVLEDVDEVGISLIGDQGRIEPRAGTGPLVWQLGAVQAHLREGPCQDLVHDGSARIIVVNRIRDEQRWSRYVRRAQGFGLRAEMAVALLRGDRLEGFLNVYSTEAEEIGQNIPSIASAFAQLAGAALDSMSAGATGRG